MSKGYFIRNASELVTCTGDAPKRGKQMEDIGIIDNGSLIIEDGIIKAVGTTDQLEKQYNINDYTIIDATNKAVLPGFIDSHTHFVFGGYRAEEFGWRLKGDSYMSIMERGGGIAATVKATHAASKQELLDAGLERLRTMLEFGITTVEGKSGYGLDKETEIRQLEVLKELNNLQPVDIVSTFMGAHAVPDPYKGKEREYLDFILKEVLPEIKIRDLADFVDIFTEKNVFSIEDSKYFLQKARELNFKLKAHVDEIAPLFGGAEMAAELGATSADHLLQASDNGIQKMAKSNVIATLLPATAFSLKEDFAKARQMIDSGCAVALASDLNPGSCFTNSIPLIIALACIYMKMSIEEVISALTINGAAAVGKESSVGSLEVGKKADVVILKYPSIHYLPYHTGINIVETVLKNGETVVKKGKGI